MKAHLASMMMVLVMAYGSAVSAAIGDPYSLNQEGLEVAEMIISLAPGIVGDLNPPARGAERTVTKGTIDDNGSRRIYYIEGQDVYHNGRVLGTYWMRLTKLYGANSNNASVLDLGMNASLLPDEGRPMSPETHELIGPLLNVIYDIEAMSLTHNKVKLEEIVKANHDPLSYEIYGVNDICEHVELNQFKIAFSRHIDERNHPSFVTEIFPPYHADNGGNK
jgi:hypothetical protein